MSEHIDVLLGDGEHIALVARFLMGSQSADDLAQDVAVAAIELAGKIEDGVSPPINDPTAWRWRVGRNLSINQRLADERRRAREEALGAVSPRYAAPVDEIAAGNELRMAIQQAVRGLKPIFRDPVHLCLLEGQDRREVSRRLGIPISTLQTRLARARDELRSRLCKMTGRDQQTLNAGLIILVRPSARTANGVAVGSAGVSLSWMFATMTVLALLGAFAWISTEEKPRGATTAMLDLSRDAILSLGDRAHEGGRVDLEPPARSPAGSSVTYVEGWCVDENAQPIADAVVVADGWATVDPARSESDGHFRIRGIVTDNQSGLRLRATAVGFAHGIVEYEHIQLGASLNVGDIVLEPAAFVSGKVIGSDGNPIEGARVVCGDDETISGRNGAFRFPHCAQGWRRISVRSEASDGDPDADIELAGLVALPLRSGIELSGVELVVEDTGSYDEDDDYASEYRRVDLVDPMGTALGAGVDLAIWALEPGDSRRWRLMLEKETDDRGGFDVLRRYDHVAVVTRDSEGRAFAGSTHVADYETLRLAPVNSRLVDLSPRSVEDRSPITTASCIVATRFDNGFPHGDVDHRLRFLSGSDPTDAVFLVDSNLSGVRSFTAPLKPFVVEVFAHGYLAIATDVYYPASVTSDLIVDLKQGWSLQGTVGSGSDLVRGARVMLMRPMASKNVAEYDNLLSRYLEAETDDRGFFGMTVTLGGDYVVRVECPGFAPFESSPVSVLPHESAEVEISLRRGGAVEGRLVVPSPWRSAGYIVSVVDDPAAFGVTDANGHFRIDRLPPGDCELEIASHGQSPSTLGLPNRVSCHIVDEEVRALGDVVLKGPAFVVSGRVVVDGRVRSDLFVSLESREQAVDTAERGARKGPVRVAPDGTYDVRVDTPGEYVLSLYTNYGSVDKFGIKLSRSGFPVSPSWIAHSAVLETRVLLGEGRESLVIDLSLDLGSVAGVVRPMSGDSVTLEWFGPNGAFASRSAGVIDGRFDFPSVPAGLVRIRYGDLVRDAVVAAGECAIAVIEP